MFETATYRVEHRFPQVPVRQWVITLPKRLRYFLLRDSKLTGGVLQISLRVIERTLRAHCPDAPLSAKYGGITYIHRFGSMLTCIITVASLTASLHKPKMDCGSTKPSV